ncbi:MAG: helix-turn-helix transcriptional regulator [Bacteriovoracaceae bacterium]|nr:helix-turn-helix transcriptional regulator [Bacteriovoracaceae bacterium]
MRSFEHIAKLIRTKRLSHEKGYSQSELSHLLGYKNGQFISNVERALCNIPLKMLGRVSEVLNIDPEELKQSILKDQEHTLDNYLKMGLAQEASVTIPGREDFDGAANATMVEGQFKPFF